MHRTIVAMLVIGVSLYPANVNSFERKMDAPLDGFSLPHARTERGWESKSTQVFI